MAEYYPIIWLSEGGDAVQIGASTMSRESAIALAKRLLAVLDPAPMAQPKQVIRRQLTPTERQNIVARYAAGEGASNIARDVGRSPGHVISICRKSGAAPHNQLISEAQRIRQAARRNGGASP